MLHILDLLEAGLGLLVDLLLRLRILMHLVVQHLNDGVELTRPLVERLYRFQQTCDFILLVLLNSWEWTTYLISNLWADWLMLGIFDIKLWTPSILVENLEEGV